MKYILMNKKTKVLAAEYETGTGIFTKIYDIYNIEFAPYILKNLYNQDDKSNSFIINLSERFKGRGIPSWRDKLDLLLHRLNITAPSELLDKSFGLSLSDQYWLKPFNLNIDYDAINFFDNDFDYTEFLEASLSKNSKLIASKKSLNTPNNTTDGMLKKAWIIENKIRYLLKGGYKNELLQPFNEVLASEICARLGFNHVKYTLVTYKDTICSKCPCFINKDTEFIPCHQLIKNLPRHNNIEDYEAYISLLETNGILDARTKLENMFILDFLIMNEDRHLNNFGIIRDANTLKWLDIAPIFDNGQSLKIDYYNEEELNLTSEARFFYEIKPFDELIKIVADIKRIDLNKLDGLVEWFDNLLHEYQNLTNFSDLRINRLCIILNNQINKLKKLAKK